MTCEHCADNHPTERCPLRSPEQQAVMDAARDAQVLISRGENGKRRKASVERYMWQFINGAAGKGASSAQKYKAGHERIFRSAK